MEGKLNYGSTGMIMSNAQTGLQDVVYVYGWRIEEKGSRYHYVVTDTRIDLQKETRIFVYDKRNDKRGYIRDLSSETRQYVRETLFSATGHDVG